MDYIRTSMWTLTNAAYVVRFMNVFALLMLLPHTGNADLEDWWTYEGISGQQYWGLLNTEWRLCNRGKYQSPVDIQPSSLVYDPSLTRLTISKSATLLTLKVANTGHDITAKAESKHMITIAGGPLAYRYRVTHIKIHFGSNDTKGSEHTVAGTSFPAEIHIIAYNQDLYHNMTAAAKSPHGIAIIAIFARISDKPNKALDKITQAAEKVRYKGQETLVKNVEVSQLLHHSDRYVTYEGSLTFPPCFEVVTWVVLNRPITITSEQLKILRTMNQIEPGSVFVRMENNFRNTMPHMSRTLRTNIRSSNNDDCMRKITTKYEVNDKFRQ